jgi:murein DD-endopeptidase MepM/ murein hydrolase activator NlpD
MKNDFILLEHLKVLQQKLSSTDVPNRSKSINETSATSNSIFGGSSVKIPADGAHKGQSGWQSNNAWDIPTPIGTPIYAVADGTLQTFNDYGPTVIKTKGKKLFGQGFTVKSDNGLPDLYYAHLKDSVVKKGDKVKCGQLLGYVMDFPNSSYDHLHIGVKTGHNIKEFLNTDGTLKCGGTISGKVSEPIQSTSGDKNNSDEELEDESNDEELEDESNDDDKTTTTTKKGSFLDFFKNLGGIFKEEEEVSKIQEDVQRIKNLLK